MQYITELDRYRDDRRSAVTLGKFDGLHRGHQQLVGRVKEHAAAGDMVSIVCAFDMAPLYERLGQTKKGLMTNRERCERLRGEVDYLIECPFTETLSGMEAEAFIKDILVDRFHAACIVVGTDYRFGHEKRGDIAMLEQYAGVYGYTLEVVEKERYGEREISSTYIKEEVRLGNMETVRRLLGYRYTIEGTVQHGRQLGRTLGIPTMNLFPAPDKLTPPNGVYGCRVQIDGRRYGGIANIGCKPTVECDGRESLEVYVFGYSGNTYGRTIQVELSFFVRPEKRFASLEELKKQMEADICRVREEME